MQSNTDIQSEALPSLFCFQGLFHFIFGRGDHRFYDQLSRLLEADYNNGTNVYNYGYDVAGNMVDYDGVTRTYNAANQMVNDGTNALTYDNNGNLRTVGSDTYTWDRANRLLSVGNHSYVYDGLGNRVQQTVSSVVTDYLNDLQPGLTKLLKQDDGTNVEHFAHAVRGIHAVDDGTDWNFYAQDGLGSVRALVDDAAAVVSSHSYSPIGVPDSDYGAGFWFTGEQTDENDNIYLRARYMNPNMGTFLSLDPFEGVHDRPMSLNGYSWVEGNTPNSIDPSGMQSCPCDIFVENPSLYSACKTGTGINFVYNRQNAANKAIQLAGERNRGDTSANTSHILNGIQFAVAQGGTDSAIFISLALRAGGFPMTSMGGFGQCATNRVSADENHGWCVRSLENGNYEGNLVWSNHNRTVGIYNSITLSQDTGLAGYLLGNRQATSSGVYFAGGGGNALEMSVEQVFGIPEGADPNFAYDLERELPNLGDKYAYLRAIAPIISLRLLAYTVGDYIVTTGNFPHGFMIVGHGPVTTCEENDKRVLSTSTVPYVADLGGVQSGNRRPFYCSRVKEDPNNPESFFGHRYWYFVKVPDSGSITSSRLYNDPLPR